MNIVPHIPYSGLCGQDFFFLGIFAALALALTVLDTMRGPHVDQS